MHAHCTTADGYARPLWCHPELVTTLWNINIHHDGLLEPPSSVSRDQRDGRVFSHHRSVMRRHAEGEPRAESMPLVPLP